MRLEIATLCMRTTAIAMKVSLTLQQLWEHKMVGRGEKNIGNRGCVTA